MGSIRTTAKLAIRGGERAVAAEPGDLFTWPIVTAEDEQAVLDVLRRGAMSGNDVTRLFEKEMAAYFGAKHALGSCNGTAALLGAMWACGVGRGDELIGPSLTYWASVLPALSLGATIVFADCEAHSICIDPADIAGRITGRTRAIVCTHNYGHPCDMDPIMAVARKHGVKVIEDVSHAQGGHYKGRKLGTIGDVGCMSLMAGKALVAGEAGMIVTDDRRLWERAISFGFYERTGASNYAKPEDEITEPDLLRFAGLPLGGVKHRMNQTCAAMGRVQLKYYPERIVEIQRAMNFFWDSLAGVPGIRAHRVEPGSGSTMGGWYHPIGLYRPEELGGLPVADFVAAVVAEGVNIRAGANWPLHLHPMLHEADVYGDGRPTVIANSTRDVRQGPGSLPVSESVPGRVFTVPWFKHYRPEAIKQYASALRKVAENAEQVRERGR
jgi:dTDP-4-amino-4,6-dideoxygalactose transaminase